MGERLLQWTGHPLVDVGVATLCAMANKTDPADLTLEDLDAAGTEIREAYEIPEMLGFLTCVYMNSAYVQPATRKKNPEKYKTLVTRLTQAHRTSPDPESVGLMCAITGHSAAFVVNRTEMPLLAANGVVNFPWLLLPVTRRLNMRQNLVQRMPPQPELPAGGRLAQIPGAARLCAAIFDCRNTTPAPPFSRVLDSPNARCLQSSEHCSRHDRSPK